MKKGFGLIGIIIVVVVTTVLIGGGFYFNKQSQQKSTLQIGREAVKQAEELKKQIETANWRTYTNIKYNFELKYPDNWVVISSKDPRQSNLEELDNLYIHDRNEEFPPLGISLSVLSGEELKQLQQEGNTELKVINELPWVMYSYYDEFDETGHFSTGYSLLKEGRAYYLVASDISKSTLDQILSTFKFIN